MVKISSSLTSCLIGLDESFLQIKTKIVSSHTADSKPVKQEVRGTVIPPPLVFPAHAILSMNIVLHQKNHLPLVLWLQKSYYCKC
jgi:hypothetical protein